MTPLLGTRLLRGVPQRRSDMNCQLRFDAVQIRLVGLRAQGCCSWLTSALLGSGRHVVSRREAGESCLTLSPIPKGPAGRKAEPASPPPRAPKTSRGSLSQASSFRPSVNSLHDARLCVPLHCGGVLCGYPEGGFHCSLLCDYFAELPFSRPFVAFGRALNHPFSCGHCHFSQREPRFSMSLYPLRGQSKDSVYRSGSREVQVRS